MNNNNQSVNNQMNNTQLNNNSIGNNQVNNLQMMNNQPVNNQVNSFSNGKEKNNFLHRRIQSVSWPSQGHSKPVA